MNIDKFLSPSLTDRKALASTRNSTKAAKSSRQASPSLPRQKLCKVFIGAGKGKFPSIDNSAATSVEKMLIGGVH